MNQLYAIFISYPKRSHKYMSIEINPNKLRINQSKVTIGDMTWTS